MTLRYPSKEVLHSWLFRNSTEKECGKEIGFLTLSSLARVCKNKRGGTKIFSSFYFTSITAHSSCLLELLPRWPFCFFSASSSYYLPFADQEVGRREKGDKNIWYVSSTTNCCYKENIDIIYQLHGGYRKDKTLTSLLQSSNSFVFITSLSPEYLARMFYLLVCSRWKKNT